MPYYPPTPTHGHHGMKPDKPQEITRSGIASTDAMLSDLEGTGWYVYTACDYNLPSRPAHRWEVCLRHPDSLIAKSTGATLAEALSRAIDRIPDGVVEPLPTYTCYTGKPVEASDDLSAILEKLVPKKPAIPRRL
jgi:hypothetical protein